VGPLVATCWTLEFAAVPVAFLAMLIKSADDKSGDLLTLETLLGRRDLSSARARLIRREIGSIRAGAKAERDAAYQIDFYLRDAPNMMAIHDLRIAYADRVAQIDHLIINRGCDIWVCESKSFSEGVSINEHGEWCSYRRGKPYGIASPIEQNKHHIAVLKNILDGGQISLPKRLGLTVKPDLQSLILVSHSARIDRPKNALAVDGLDSVIKSDQLMTTIDRSVDQRMMKSVLKLIGLETLEKIARSLAALHKPLQVDWEARFGLSPQDEGVALVANGHPTADAAQGPGAGSREQCASCSGPLSAKVADYCRVNNTKFQGRLLCWRCQKSVRSRDAMPPARSRLA
jgi:hypothetical protein